MTNDVRWLAEYEENGELYFRVGTTGPEVIAEWLGMATFIARRDGSEPRLTFEDGTDPRDAEKIRRGSAWLLQRQLDGRLGLHGSAVSLDGKAAVLLGRSGAGKSTMAAALCLQGTDLLADDAVGIDPASDGGWVVLPRETDHWLDPSSIRALHALAGEAGARSKEPRATARPAKAPARLAMFIELAFTEASEPTVRSQRGIEAVGCLVPQLARLVLDEPERQRRELDFLHTVVAATPIYRLERPKRFDRLAPAVDSVLELLRR